MAAGGSRPGLPMTRQLPMLHLLRMMLTDCGRLLDVCSRQLLDVPSRRASWLELDSATAMLGMMLRQNEESSS
eukprot:766058-Hanusia_phi.AAC.1